MFNTAGEKKVYLKGTCNAILSDVKSGDILYQDNKFTTGSITTSVSLNEIRAGLGNAIAAMIPSDSGLTVEFESAAFNLWMKAAQVGAAVSYGAPSPVCQVVEASSASISIDVSGGTPVANYGYSEPFCFVQTVGAASSVARDGHAYKINPSTGAIEGFTATAGTKYKVWYFVKKVSAQSARLSTMFDPVVAHFEAQIAAYANESGQNNEGTRCGWFYVIVPYLKLNGESTITGDQANNDTTKISGQAIAYDADVVSAECTDCESSTLAYYIYVPDDASEGIEGLTIFGGVINVPASSSVQVPVRMVMEDGSTVEPSSYSEHFTYELDEAPTGTTVSASGVITAGSTAGDCELSITYNDGKPLTCVANVSVLSA